MDGAFDGRRLGRVVKVWLPFAAALATLAAARREAAPERAFGQHDSRDEPRQVQVERSVQPERGRDATAPWLIPRSGWRDIAWRTYAQINEDRILAVAGGVVFYAILAIFPALTAIVSLYGLFANAATVADGVALASSIVPTDTLEILRVEALRIAAKSNGTLSLSLVFGLGIALWSANSGMKAIIDALNIVYEETEKRSFIKLNLLSLAFTGGAVIVAILAVVAVVALPLLLNSLGLGFSAEAVIRTLRWPLLVILLFGGLSLIYCYGPSRTRARWQWLSVGSLFATAAWIAASAVFSFYLSNVADYSATYGALGAIIGMMTWIWLSVIVILVGAELNSEIEHQTAEDSTVGAPKPLGLRGATMADTVGEIP
jgi:membrane protein